MINFAGYYYINERDVVSVEKVYREATEFRFGVKVKLRSGETYTVNYADETTRDRTAKTIADQVDKMLGREYEVLKNRIYLMEGSLKRLDKRQLRIWQQLKELLGVEVEEK